MEGTAIPPPTAPSPGIGESSKLRGALDLLNITKVLALIIGILGFLLAAWNGIIDIIFGDVLGILWVGYYVIMGIMNLLIYTKIPEYDSLIRSRRYGEAKERMLLWAVIGILFGFLAGLLLILVMFMYLEELERTPTPYPPPPPQY